MNTKVVVNLATGMEDPERVMVAFLVGQAAAAKGKQVTMFLTKDAVHLAVPGHAHGEACGGCPPIERLFAQYAEAGGCPICVKSRGLESTKFATNATVAGATPLWDWIGDEAATVFSY